ncbi:hypothetical protein PGTUg99_036833 [Puccinia graminis f. sp. tritici]|uniref:Uncharacterized protein n=1 Tax=Puccinia graminis f. sp. tritici TaxID=56615 RepID=A0A5B0QW97_PUCGR|nr:hypothetical protein PGTUg99_036833 [Puccinia graminis f. sp. tritici]
MSVGGMSDGINQKGYCPLQQAHSSHCSVFPPSQHTRLSQPAQPHKPILFITDMHVLSAAVFLAVVCNYASATAFPCNEPGLGEGVCQIDLVPIGNDPSACRSSHPYQSTAQYPGTKKIRTRLQG